MGLEEIIPSITLILILILILPNFINSNLKKKVFFRNLSIWAVIIIILMIVLYFIN